MFWFYVELFCLLLYKYLDGFGITANGGGAIAVNVVWWQQSVITNVWIRVMPKRIYSQRPTIICKGELRI